jgi:hypothetical protein
MQWIIDKIKNNKVLLILAFACVVPYFAYQNMKTRLHKGVYDLDASVPGVQLHVADNGTRITYQDGSTILTDGLGVAAATWADHQKNPERLTSPGYQPQESQFPVVVFFNRSGFDATGKPVCIRQASDGKVVWHDDTERLVTTVVPQREGGFLVYLVGYSHPVQVSEVDWYTKYMGVDPPLASIPPEQLEKMTDEQLTALGIKRVPKEQPKDAKSGLKGIVFRAGGDPAIQPLKLPVLILKGSVTDEVKDLKAWAKQVVAAEVVSDDKGFYQVPLEPGEYTVVVEENGKLWGNALKPDRFPTVKVKKDTWTEYDFRRPN